MEITLAKSKAGHDKNHVYVIIGTEQDLVYLANGRTKTCEHPKTYTTDQASSSRDNRACTESGIR